MRRSEPNRAVFYVTNWLLQTQRLENYFGVTYNVYEIYQQDERGQWVQIETGGVANAETRRTSTRQESVRSKKPNARNKEVRGQANARALANNDRRDGIQAIRDAMGAPKMRSRTTSRSPFQQRVSAELGAARQRLMDSKRKG